ncbi:MAG: bifunctional [glutamine synthetase] adenylyltransferase/[glutamine synthetase]-adenylyl-L-tyrosine phosphorylase [Pseudorhodobacter sp.]|nr:bifunctional [glutamine synthetase] adenylyltransferase/[glutamine synthetase]-adenylyl-L-tyrosine phosphorylase [Pseudorhodobacter sp.]
MMAQFAQRMAARVLTFDEAAGRDVAQHFADLEVAEFLARVAGGSPYLKGLMLREEAFLRVALTQDVDQVVPAEIAVVEGLTVDALGAGLRRAKRRVALWTGLCDLGGVWALDQVTGALTALADAAVTVCLQRLVEEEVRRGKLPGGDAGQAGGMVALAMGKMGAGELNYSSDIDLICLYDEARYPGVEQEARACFIRVTRKMTALLSDITAEGYVFRVDLRLRPDASVTPVCISMAAAEGYYEAEGRTWERAAFIKARPCGGDLAAGSRFLKTLVPFVWRKHLDFAAIQDAHDMRLRIREHRGLNGRLVVEGHDLKLGRGGIREIEFFTQTRQLIAGGRDQALRLRGTVEGLRALAAKGWVPPEVAEELVAAYHEHRALEHRLQMVLDQQTHRLPVTADGVARVAALSGQTEAAFRAGLLARLARVEGLIEGFFAPGVTEAAPVLTDRAQAIVERWWHFPALRSERAQAIFRRLLPVLLRKLEAAAHGDEALLALDGFLAGLPAGVQVFSLFDANPALVDLIIDIAATSPDLARHLSRHAGVLDSVIGGSFFAPWPGADGLTEALAAQVAVGDYEKALDAARVWMGEWHFRIGVHHLRGLIDGFQAGQQYADLAEAVVAALWPVVVRAFEARHGPAPGRGAVVVGMGSLGAGRLNAGSDLDLIVIYDAAGGEASAGPRPLAARTYFARLTQSLVTALTVPMAEGRLYEVDMRLRPSGRQGPVATSLDSFLTYQMEQAWTWEHLALTRARVLAGEPSLATEVEALRCQVLTTKAGGAAVVRDVAEMRARLAEARPGRGALEAKAGPGKMMDVELFAQMLALQAGAAGRGVESQLAAGIAGGKVSQTEATALLDAYRFCWRLRVALKLISDPATLGQGAAAFVLRETGQPGLDALVARLAEVAAAADAVITAKLDQSGLGE